MDFFLAASAYEKQLEQQKNRRKKQLEKKPSAAFKQDNGVKRRILNLYDRACRKFKQNKALWKEYLEFLAKARCLQKLNQVAANAVLVHPDALDFWLVGVYAELDLKGNLFSARNLMLQALRLNDQKPAFALAYLRFEVKFLDKLMLRRQLLAGDKVLNQQG